MTEHVYKAKFLGIESGIKAKLRFEVDLGFGVKISKWFTLYEPDPVYLDLWLDDLTFVENELNKAEEIFIHSFRRVYEKYAADVTYRIGDKWYNILKSLKDLEHASE